MIRAIVFDCFGVLVGHSFRDVYRSAGGDPARDKGFLDDLLRRASAGFISGDELCRKAAKQLHISFEQFAAFLARMEQPNEALFDYISQILKPRYKIGMLSNAARGGPQRRLSAAQLAIFDDIVVSAAIGHQKPEPEAFRITAYRLGIGFDEMIFVDDLEPYVAAAAALGIPAVRYADLESLKQQLHELLQ